MGSFESMLRLLVPPQVHFPLETLPAQVAAERFESRVFPAVRDQVGALTEGLPTHLTFVRLLTCVDEGVLLHVRLLVEPLPAVLTRIGPRVRVDEKVRGERGGALEAFPTDFAAEAPLLRVDRPVLIQTHGVPEGFPADAALERPRPAVRPPHVDLQTVGCRKHLAAFDALKGSARFQVGADEIVFGLDLRLVLVLFDFQIQFVSVPHPADLLRSRGIIWVTSGPEAPLRVKRLGGVVFRPVTADGGVGLPVALQVVLIRPLDQMPELRPGVRRPGVGEQWNVEGTVLCWSGAFLRIW